MPPDPTNDPNFPQTDLFAFVEGQIGRPLSLDARFLLQLAVNLGIARATERNISIQFCASWINLLGAALLAPDPTSRWLQEKRDFFDLDEILPSKVARVQAMQPTNPVAENPNQPPVAQATPFFTASAVDQLKAAAVEAAPRADIGTPGVVDAFHIIASLILQPVSVHNAEPTIGRGDEQNRSDIERHMAILVADKAFAFDLNRSTALIGIVTSHLSGTEAVYSQASPELANAAGISLTETAQDWNSGFEKWAPTYPTKTNIISWRAAGPLGRLLIWHQALPSPADALLKRLFDLVNEAAGQNWAEVLPGEGGALAGRGLTLFARASVLAAKVNQTPEPVIDFYHIIGAVLAPPEAPLPPSFEPFPAFRPELLPADRQAFRRRFLALVSQRPQQSEQLTVWADLILGEHLTTARIATDLLPSEDLLGFGRYANAFASVIADRDVSAPLAIGLFGVWGSGKSAMIDMISNALLNIDFRAKLDRKPRFCRGIVRITFNAWHYAEANLWASIFVRILDEMAHHLRIDVAANEQDESDISLLALAKAHEEKQVAETELAVAELAAARAAQDTAKAKQDLAGARRAEAELLACQAHAVAAAQAEKAVRFDALELAGDAAAMLLALGRPVVAEIGGEEGTKLVDALNNQRNQISELAASFMAISTPLRRLKLVLGWSRIRLFYLGLVAAVLFLITVFILFLVHNRFFEGLAASVLSAIAIVTGFVTTIAPLWARGREAISRAPAIMAKLANAAENVRAHTERRDAAAAKEEIMRETATAEIVQTDTEAARAISIEQRADLAVATARAKVNAARYAVAAAEGRIADMAPERLLSRFVEDRAASDEYGRELGLPTRIRKDLETLRGYINKLTNARTAERRADRIVLFIDDLDRCRPAVVVRVLEAVQILLASDLFVIVVGVDVRWLTKALEIEHAGQFDDSQVLSPLEFIEKIFQVPFWIPAMSALGSRAVVEHALPQLRQVATVASALGGAAPPPEEQAVTPDDEKQEDKRDKHPEPLPTLEPVELTAEEHAALLRWGALAGDTPRRLKRFARSYLILRASLSPAQRDVFIANSEFDLVARLLAFNTAAPDRWSRFASFVSSATESAWTEGDHLGPIGKLIFVDLTMPPAPSPGDCLPWLGEVERFGFVAAGRNPMR